MITLIAMPYATPSLLMPMIAATPLLPCRCLSLFFFFFFSPFAMIFLLPLLITDFRFADICHFFAIMFFHAA